MDQNRSYINLAVEKTIRLTSEIQVKQKEIITLKNRLNTAIKSIDSIQTLLTEQAKELKLFMTDIEDGLNGKF